MPKLVAHIAAIYRYPVKSMRGESLESCPLTPNGLRGDRSFAWKRSPDTHKALTARQIPAMLHYQAHYRDDTQEIEITAPDGRRFSPHDEELRLQLQQQQHTAHTPIAPIGIHHDDSPLSLISRATLDEIAQRTQITPDAQRFRINLVLDTLDPNPFNEETWLTRSTLSLSEMADTPSPSLHNPTLSLGERADTPSLRLIKKIVRCRLVNLHPQDAHEDPHILRFLAHHRESCLGLYASPLLSTSLRVGMPVFLD